MSTDREVKQSDRTRRIADARIGCNDRWMKRIALLVTYAALEAVSVWVFYLNLDWRPDQARVPIALVLFVVFALASLIVLIVRAAWWLPGTLLLSGFTTIPWALSFAFTAGYIVWFLALAACASGIGWYARPR